MSDPTPIARAARLPQLNVIMPCSIAFSGVLANSSLICCSVTAEHNHTSATVSVRQMRMHHVGINRGDRP